MSENSRKRDKESTCEAILEAAEELFAERGYSATSLSAIASAADVTKSLIHHHFGSKQELWQVARKRVFVDLFETLRKEQKASAQSYVETMRSYFDIIKTRPRLVRMMSWALFERAGRPDEDGDFELVDLDLSRLSIGWMETAQKAGHVRGDFDVRALLMLFVSTVWHYFETKQAFDGSDRLPIDDLDERYISTATKIIEKGLMPAG